MTNYCTDLTNTGRVFNETNNSMVIKGNTCKMGRVKATMLCEMTLVLEASSSPLYLFCSFSYFFLVVSSIIMNPAHKRSSYRKEISTLVIQKDEMSDPNEHYLLP